MKRDRLGYPALRALALAGVVVMAKGGRRRWRAHASRHGVCTITSLVYHRPMRC
jgi:hypothetical protein